MKEVIEILELEIRKLNNLKQLAKQSKESYVVGFFTKKINKINKAINILANNHNTKNK